MTRAELRKIINDAHSALHSDNAEAAHEILHAGTSIQESAGSMSNDQEVLEAAQKFNEYSEGLLVCGHRIADLISSHNSITMCGACVQEFQTRRNASMRESTEKRGVEW